MANNTLKSVLMAALTGIGLSIAVQSPAAAQDGCAFRFNPRMAESMGIQVPQNCNTPAVQAPAAQGRKAEGRRDRKVEAPRVREHRRVEPDRGRRNNRRGDRRRADENWGYEPDRIYRRQAGRTCSPHRAVWKASRMGLANAHIARIRRHRIVVAGWDQGYRARIVFAREPHCPVIAYR